MDYRIVTDGSCDLPPELCRSKDIDVVPFYVSFDRENYEGNRRYADQEIL